MRERGKASKTFRQLCSSGFLFPEILRIPEGNFFLEAAQMRCRVREESKGQRTKKKEKQKKTKKNSLSSACGIRRGIGLREIVFQNG
jgi:hypothetical protein